MPEQDTPKQKSKRTTIADLKKDLQEVEQLIDENILDELAAHEVRLGELESFLVDTPATWGEKVDSRLVALEEGIKEKPDGAVTNVTDRLTALENVNSAVADAARTIGEGTAEWGTRMEDAEDSIHSLQAAISDMQESAEPPGLDFVVRKSPETSDRLYPSELKAVAQVAQTMSDVLMLTRVLKADKNFSDDERREIMSIVCKAANVDYAENLLTRAGVRHFEA